MITAGRLAAITIVLLALGFVGAVWFAATEAGDRLVSTLRPTPRAASVAPGPPNGPSSTPPPVPSQAEVSPIEFQGGSTGLEPKPERTDLLPSPGCSWYIEPRPLPANRYWVVTTPDRALFGITETHSNGGPPSLSLVQSLRPNAPDLTIRPVYFDKAGTSYIPTTRGRGSSTMGTPTGTLASLQQTFFFLPFNAPPPGAVVYFGIERVVPNAAELLSVASQKTAKEMGITIPPTPLVGKPYDFDLTTIDGQRLRSRDYLGKPVLIGIVQGADSTFDNIVRPLKDMREVYHEGVLELIHVFLDRSPEKARATLTNHRADTDATAPVVAPDDPKIRRLWRDGAQVNEALICYFIDAKGILRAMGPTHEMLNALRPKNDPAAPTQRSIPFVYDRPPRVGPPRLEELTKKTAPTIPPKTAPRPAPQNRPVRK